MVSAKGTEDRHRVARRHGRALCHTGIERAERMVGATQQEGVHRREQQQRRLLAIPCVRSYAEQLGIASDATGEPVVERRVGAAFLIRKAHKALRQYLKLLVGYRLHHPRSSGAPALWL